MPDAGEIHITLEDLNSETVERNVGALRSAGRPDLVRPVGDPNSAGRGSGLTILFTALYGLAGALIGALVLEVVAQPDSSNPWYGTNSFVATFIYFGGVALFIGVAFSVGDSIETRNAAKIFRQAGLGIAIMIGPVLVATIIANLLWQHLWLNYLESLSSLRQFDSAVDSIRQHLMRGLAWGVCALGMGIGLGAAKRSGRAVLNGAAAGLIGGFIGGFLFDYFRFSSGTINRIVADVIIGGLIGLALGLISEITKQHWIEIAAGGMAGKQFIIFSNRTSVGSSPSADITLIKDPAIAPVHLHLIASGKELSLASDPPAVVAINGTPVMRQQLVDGDLVLLGSTVLRYRSKEEALPSLKA